MLYPLSYEGSLAEVLVRPRVSGARPFRASLEIMLGRGLPVSADGNSPGRSC